MGWFRRRIVIDLTKQTDPGLPHAPAVAEATPRPTSDQLQAGVPGRCSNCDGFGYIDHIDMAKGYQRQHCRSCGHQWEYRFDQNGSVSDVIDLRDNASDRTDRDIRR